MFIRYDWVTGFYNHRPFWGYIANFYNHHKNATVNVTMGAAKSEVLINVNVNDLEHWTGSLLMTEDIYSMIDLSLQTHDEDWFNELIACLESEEMT